MSEIANKLITLSLNAKWQPIGYKTVKDAIVGLTGSETKSEASSLAIDIEYELTDAGEPIFENVTSMRPVSWSEWITLPIRPWDLSITGACRSFRVPTVIVSVAYNRMPRKEFKGKPSKDDILFRDNYTCQVTGEKLPKEQLNLDHVIPKSRGGTDDWENLVTCRKDINNKKGNKLNSEIGIKLIKQPIRPKAIDVMHLIKEARHRDWKLFISK